VKAVGHTHANAAAEIADTFWSVQEHLHLLLLPFTHGARVDNDFYAAAPVRIVCLVFDGCVRKRLLWLEADNYPNKQQLVISMAQSTLAEQIVDKRLLMETGEVDFLEHAELVNNADVWRNKEIRVNTRQIYRQDK
jgi:hypothetical protein